MKKSKLPLILGLATVTAGAFTGAMLTVEQTHAKEENKTSQEQQQIQKTNIESLAISEIQDKEYTGEAITPPVIIMNGQTQLELDNDYSLDYSNNINIGIADVLITGKGQFEGSKTIHFNITKKVNAWISEPAIDWNNLNSDCLGEAKYGTVELYVKQAQADDSTYLHLSLFQDGSIEVDNEETDWDILESIWQPGNNITCKVVVKESGVYTGLEKIITSVIPHSVYVDSLPSCPYNGMRWEPDINVLDDFTGVYLERDVDYMVIYRNNIDVGTATARITFIGEYADVKPMMLNFEIKLANDITVEAASGFLGIVDGFEQYPAGEELEFQASCISGDEVEFLGFFEYDENGEWGEQVTGPLGVGKYWVEFSSPETEEYCGMGFAFLIEIVQNVVVAPIDYVCYFNANEPTTPEPYIYLNTTGRQLEKDVDYTLSYRDNTTIGIGYCDITFIGDYSDLEPQTLSFEIKYLNEISYNLVQGVLGNNKFKVGEQISASATCLSGDNVVIDYAYRHQDGSAGPYSPVIPTDANQYYVRFSAPTNGNYAENSVAMAFDIVYDVVVSSTYPLWNDGGWPESFPIQFAGETVTPEPYVYLNDNNYYNMLSNGRDYTLSYSNNTSVGTGTVTVTFIGNYAEFVPVNITFIIKNKNIVNGSLTGMRGYTNGIPIYEYGDSITNNFTCSSGGNVVVGYYSLDSNNQRIDESYTEIPPTAIGKYCAVYSTLETQDYSANVRLGLDYFEIVKANNEAYINGQYGFARDNWPYWETTPAVITTKFGTPTVTYTNITTNEVSSTFPETSGTYKCRVYVPGAETYNEFDETITCTIGKTQTNAYISVVENGIRDNYAINSNNILYLQDSSNYITLSSGATPTITYTNISTNIVSSVFPTTPGTYECRIYAEDVAEYEFGGFDETVTFTIYNNTTE